MGEQLKKVKRWLKLNVGPFFLYGTATSAIHIVFTFISAHPIPWSVTISIGVLGGLFGVAVDRITKVLGLYDDLIQVCREIKISYDIITQKFVGLESSFQRSNVSDTLLGKESAFKSINYIFSALHPILIEFANAIIIEDLCVGQRVKSIYTTGIKLKSPLYMGRIVTYGWEWAASRPVEKERSFKGIWASEPIIPESKEFQNFFEEQKRTSYKFEERERIVVYNKDAIKTIIRDKADEVKKFIEANQKAGIDLYFIEGTNAKGCMGERADRERIKIPDVVILANQLALFFEIGKISETMDINSPRMVTASQAGGETNAGFEMWNGWFDEFKSCADFEIKQGRTIGIRALKILFNSTPPPESVS